MERHPTFIFYLFPDRTEEAKEERVLFPVTQLRPHPKPLRKGEGVYLKWLGTLQDNYARKLPSALVLQFHVLTRTFESVDKFAYVVFALELMHPKVETIEIAIRRIVGIAL